MADDWIGGTGRGRRWTIEEETRLVELLEAGKTPSQIALILNVRIHRVKDKIKNMPTAAVDNGWTGTQERRCLGCRQPFNSEGAHNRMCNACRRRSDGMAVCYRGNGSMGFGSRRVGSRHGP